MHRRYVPKTKKKPGVAKSSGEFLLDQFSISDIRRWQAIKDKVLKFHWDYYSNLAYQRSRIADQLRKVLLEAAVKDFPFEIQP